MSTGRLPRPERGPGGERYGLVPQAFLWRGRLYVVRDILAHWYERRAWWSEVLALAVHGQSGPHDGLVAEESQSEEMPPSADREVFRVEASAGRSAGSGVYDLCRCGDTANPWCLVRVSD
ncbi:MAG: DUF6504 family protein [Actinomycetes bacterium]